ncbi:MAG: ABC transporter permease, partial [Candidatus Binatia bacterium]
LPAWMRLAAQINPMTYAIDAMRSLILTGWDAPRLFVMAIVLLFFDGAMFWLGAKVLSRHLA